MNGIMVIDKPDAAEASLDPVRARLLGELVEPASAATLADRLDLPRQKVNYHMRALERHGLVRLVEERRKGNCTERILQTAASELVLSPALLAAVEPDPDRHPDRLSARWLLALASRMVREVGELITGATRTRKRLATFGIDGTIRFATPGDRAAFAEELTNTLTALVSKYHNESAGEGREHRVVLALHPMVPRDEGDEESTDG
ncbi:helix-turn-helix domain-containing protein [Haloechinothrix sp. LS1_15]|uniref:winged helix-turn-helix domain-containing protein n=1 Tax=Haloechinothrix sp. LS1_15 TaxID=2652248 RepID=UPI0029480579|nr:helix-turn-helix domain-containing protein [Haloechinothrix sp. LS1_15]MDV6012569.1 helix-turn-helix transcriptional regulator [Haloechinothrix sp. LS1_15]